MKVYKHTIILTFIVSILSLVLASIFEFYGYNISHNDFIVNILLGVFTGAILTMIVSIPNYIIERRRFFISFYQNSKEFIYNSITALEKFQLKDNSHNEYFDKAKQIYYNIIYPLPDYCTWFIESDNDVFVREVMLDINAFVLDVNAVSDLYNKYKNSKANQDHLMNSIAVLFDTMNKKYYDKFKEYNSKIIEMHEIIYSKIDLNKKVGK